MHKAEAHAVSPTTLHYAAKLKKMAGVVGFEPTVHCTKNSCLTTWLHPNGERLNTICLTKAQDLKLIFLA